MVVNGNFSGRTFQNLCLLTITIQNIQYEAIAIVSNAIVTDLKQKHLPIEIGTSIYEGTRLRV